MQIEIRIVDCVRAGYRLHRKGNRWRLVRSGRRICPLQQTQNAERLQKFVDVEDILARCAGHIGGAMHAVEMSGDGLGILVESKPPERFVEPADAAEHRASTLHRLLEFGTVGIGDDQLEKDLREWKDCSLFALRQIVLDDGPRS